MMLRSDCKRGLMSIIAVGGFAWLSPSARRDPLSARGTSTGIGHSAEKELYRGTVIRNQPASSCGESVIGDLLGEEGALGFVSGKGERLPVGGGCLAGTAEPAQQVGLDRGQVLVSRQAPVSLQLLDFRERSPGRRPSPGAQRGSAPRLVMATRPVACRTGRRFAASQSADGSHPAAAVRDRWSVTSRYLTAAAGEMACCQRPFLLVDVTVILVGQPWMVKPALIEPTCAW